MAWDERRDGLVVLDDSKVCIHYSTGWEHVEDLGDTHGRYQVEYDVLNETVWLQDGASDPRAHWRLDRDGMLEPLTIPDFPFPPDLGCCNSSGSLTNYDMATRHFVVVSPIQELWYDYDLERDEWVRFESQLPMRCDLGGLCGISASVLEYGVILYLTAKDRAPSAYLYRHG